MTAPKRGRGKPPTRGVTRNKRFMVRMTEATYAALEVRAEAAGKGIAETASLMLELALSTNAPPPSGKALGRIE